MFTGKLTQLVHTPPEHLDRTGGGSKYSQTQIAKTVSTRRHTWTVLGTIYSKRHRKTVSPDTKEAGNEAEPAAAWWDKINPHLNLHPAEPVPTEYRVQATLTPQPSSTSRLTLGSNQGGNKKEGIRRAKTIQGANNQGHKDNRKGKGPHQDKAKRGPRKDQSKLQSTKRLDKAASGRGLPKAQEEKGQVLAKDRQPKGSHSRDSYRTQSDQLSKPTTSEPLCAQPGNTSPHTHITHLPQEGPGIGEWEWLEWPNPPAETILVTDMFYLLVLIPLALAPIAVPRNRVNLLLTPTIVQ